MKTLLGILKAKLFAALAGGLKSVACRVAFLEPFEHSTSTADGTRLEVEKESLIRCVGTIKATIRYNS